MQPRERFGSSACHSSRSHCLGTLLGTYGAFFARSVEKTEERRGKATVCLTGAFVIQIEMRKREPSTDTGRDGNSRAVNERDRRGADGRRPRVSPARTSRQHSQIELTKTNAIRDCFDLDDLSLRHREFQNRQQLCARSHDDADLAVDERGLSRTGARLDRALGDGRSVSDFRRPTASQDAVIRAQDDVWIEQRHQRVEVAFARGGKIRVHYLALARSIGLRRRRPLNPAARPAGELTRRIGRASDHLGDLVERHREQVVQDERETLGRLERVEDRQQRLVPSAGTLEACP